MSLVYVSFDVKQSKITKNKSLPSPGEDILGYPENASYAFVSPTPTPSPTPSPTPIPTPTPTPLPTATPTPIACNASDIDKSGAVDGGDYTLLVADFFKTTPAKPRADINSDGIVDLSDYSILVSNWGQSTGPCQ